MAGSVVAAAVILPPDLSPLTGLTDSKQLTPKRREQLAAAIKSCAVAWAIGRAMPGEIDRLNILQAALLAMRRAHAALGVNPGLALVDGNQDPHLPCATQMIVSGDSSVPGISAASILAKVFRDREMTIADQLFPGYGFSVHKGYPTASHRAALEQLGPCPLHRQSFGPVKRFMSRTPAAA